MSLFRFELKKLLVNKKTIIMLGVMFILYAAVGFATAYYGFGGQSNYTVYEELAEANAGPVNPEQAALSTDAATAAKERYGDNAEAISHVTSGDPVLKFDVDYADFATNVDEYYNGASTDAASDPYGIAPLQNQIDSLAQSGDTSSFEYKAATQQLETETALGTPEFANTSLWDNLFTNWGGYIVLILLFIPLAFIIAPVFSMEASTGMDNIVLSSKHGRGKIVTAKLASVVITAVAAALIYLVATFLFNFLAMGSFAGATAGLRSVVTFVRAPLGMAVWQYAFVAAGWLVLMSAVFGIVMAFISSKMKSQMATFGIGLAVLLSTMALGALGTNFTAMIQPLIDFGFANVFQSNDIFSTFSVYNILGMAVPYWAVALGVMAVLCGIGIWAIYSFQKKRTAE